MPSIFCYRIILLKNVPIIYEISILVGCHMAFTKEFCIDYSTYYSLLYTSNIHIQIIKIVLHCNVGSILQLNTLGQKIKTLIPWMCFILLSCWHVKFHRSPIHCKLLPFLLATSLKNNNKTLLLKLLHTWMIKQGGVIKQTGDWHSRFVFIG